MAGEAASDLYTDCVYFPFNRFRVALELYPDREQCLLHEAARLGPVRTVSWLRNAMQYTV
jgi:hypothetical protein